MLWKLAIAVGAAVAASFVPVLASYWFWILLLGVVIAFVIEGVRIVPQQSAWVGSDSAASTARSSRA